MNRIERRDREIWALNGCTGGEIGGKGLRKKETHDDLLRWLRLVGHGGPRIRLRVGALSYITLLLGRPTYAGEWSGPNGLRVEAETSQDLSVWQCACGFASVVWRQEQLRSETCSLAGYLADLVLVPSTPQAMSALRQVFQRHCDVRLGCLVIAGQSRQTARRIGRLKNTPSRHARRSGQTPSPPVAVIFLFRTLLMSHAVQHSGHLESSKRKKSV
ncbi:hypothetical protein B0H16DRAFT_1695687 [Mycena metata]|uniref:Uncharacterized protein n=1 Tax=Mycena metata TaxID=1033252 RepID=A0AAD7I623_9AGAR|nr:hypothetical protein B0H16DRAFT_1695687 [Mycena metata]